MTATSKSEQMPYNDVLDAFLVRLRAEVAPKTYRTYAPILLRAQRQLPHGVVAASEDELREWLWERELSDQTRITYIAAMRRLHVWLLARGISNLDPTELLPRPTIPRRLPRPVPADQLHVVLTQARQPIRLWCLVMVYTGARCGELAVLDRADITEQAVRLYGKGRKERTVPTHPVLWSAVKDLPPGPLVVTRSSDPPKRVSLYVARECRRIGPDWRPRVTAHRLRHTLATAVLSATDNLRLVQDLLGHASPATTAIYTLVTPARMAEALRSLPDWAAS